MSRRILHNREGLTLVELILTIGLVVIIFGGLSLAYSSILDSINNSELRADAATILNRQVELVHNLPYDKVGTTSGIPSGVISSTQSIAFDQVKFTITTTVRNIDDPFDGTLNGTPRDTAPADYKLVEIEASCPGCFHFIPLGITTTVAPKALENTATTGSLFVNVFDANGTGVPEATVHLTNASVTPTIDLTDTTNNSGTLQLVGVPTSTQRYHVTITKGGYSSDQTYLPGSLGSSTPLKIDSTVAANTLTQTSFSIDRASALTVITSDEFCALTPNRSISISGTKLIGTTPDVLKFSMTTTTGASGSKLFPNMEWDTYSMVLNDPSYDILGTIPFAPITINPSSTPSFRFVIQPAAPHSLLVSVKNASTGGTIPSTSVTLSKAGFSETFTTGHATVSQTDWSGAGGAGYSSQDGGVSVVSPAGTAKLVLGPGGYSTTTADWIISNTFDFGSSTTNFYTFSWNPSSEPVTTGAASLEFQIATNNDNATWNFTGPDGTPATYYTTSGSQVAAAQNGNRYLRYKAYMRTADSGATPELDDATIEFSGPCLPPSQALFNNLSSGTYLVTASAAGFASATSSVSVAGNWQQVDIPMVSL